MLYEIKADAQKFAQVIADVLQVDVLIIDQAREAVACTHLYYQDYDHIHSNSFVSRVMDERRTMWSPDRRELASCARCPSADSCTMQGFIGVPLVLGGETVGALSLIVPPRRAADIFENAAHTVAFAEKMAELLVAELAASRALRSLASVQRERETLMDTIRDAYVTVNVGGAITYANRRFFELFCPGAHADSARALGRQLDELVPHPQLRELLTRPLDLKSQLIFYKQGSHAFYGFMQCTQIYTGNERTGACFRFRPLEDARNSVISQSDDSERNISFSWAAGNYFFAEDFIDDAKRLAVTDRNVLITGEPGTGKRMLARCIHNFSNRSDGQLVVVDCFREYREFVPRTIFGILGKLQSAHRGTLIFNDIERLPNALQLELVDFLRHPVLSSPGGPELEIDVRLIFLSTRDLYAQARQGLFSDELYYRISEHELRIAPLRENPQLLERLVPSTLAYYRQLYGRPDAATDPQLTASLCRHSWPGNLRELESACDAMICPGTEHPFFTHAPALFDSSPRNQATDDHVVGTLNQLERQLIAEQLASDAPKEKIARTLGISRATLYRKIKYYGL